MPRSDKQCHLGLSLARISSSEPWLSTQLQPSAGRVPRAECVITHTEIWFSLDDNMYFKSTEQHGLSLRTFNPHVISKIHTCARET